MLNQAFLFTVLEERFHKIYQGNVLALESIQYFKLKNIRTIIVIGQQNHTKFIEYATYHRLNDGIGEAINIFEKTCQLIQNEIKRSSILVCCQNGLNWSTAVMIAYLIKIKQWQYEKAFYYIKSLQSLVNPSLALKKQLILYNTKVHSMKNLNHENRIKHQSLIVPSKFQQRIIEQSQKQQYLNDSIQSEEERHSISSNQLDKTPVFNSPKNNNVNKKLVVVAQSDIKIMKKQSITKLVRHIRNYTFQIDDTNININTNNPNEKNLINQRIIINSPKFKDEEDPVVLRHRRRRHAHRTKSAINYG
ncbi:unnamed protein product (macronuclear) [Paramecium tetraurelia]|uniref:protein-tyrosine-phosphatase n=1 Tax=Paramecium tetraurelia TaxID=5888 RepID=A0DZD5_PARTE|nr:uncharacterized protein GSPATT00003371001 [Paramecium tetraurelia]CAK88402.1 unnamed protein product [Paramecium tetraurelia]|eukprot:XP_001455799.1 hypothetical protein (macronuclear) [Paramecium tetraurelia strain d4-2]